MGTTVSALGSERFPAPPRFMASDVNAVLPVAGKTSRHCFHCVKAALAVVALETLETHPKGTDVRRQREFNSSAMAIVKTEKVRSI